jgi:hypothetical protein
MGGGGGSINVPSLGSEIGQVTKGFSQNVYPTFQRFTENEPLIQNLSQFGLQAGQAIEPYILSILQHPYDVPPELLNQATQAARGAFQARGNVYGNQALAGELLNRENVRTQRLQQALGMAGTTEQLLGYPEAVRTGSFATLANPLYALAGQQLGAETQAQIAGAEQGSANKAGMTGLGGSAIAGGATIGAAVIM